MLTYYTGHIMLNILCLTYYTGHSGFIMCNGWKSGILFQILYNIVCISLHANA